MLTRNEAYNLIKKNVKRKNVIYHMLAVEVIMRKIAKYLHEDEGCWGMIGLPHDIDYEKTENTPSKHSLLAEEMLK